MIGFLSLLIYLDESLTRNLGSLVIEGYIEKRTSKWIEDRTISGGVRILDKEQNFEEDRCGKDERDGYKGKTFNEVDTLTTSSENGKVIDSRRFVRREEELTKIFTLFEIHHQLLDGLSESNILKNVRDDWESHNVRIGDYIEVNGIIQNDSIVSYVEICTNILEGIGESNLTELSKNINNKFLNYNIMLNQLTYLKNTLLSNNTQDIIIKTRNTNIVVMMNKQCLVSGYGNIYEKSGCSCRIVCKVLKVYSSNEYIHLLRKTGQPEYYENLFIKYDKLIKGLTDNDILMPNKPKLKIQGRTLLVVPVSMYV